MSGPGGQELRQSDYSEAGMLAAPIEVYWAQIHGAEFGQILCAYANEFIQQLRERLALRFSVVSPTIEGLEGLSLTKLQDHLYAWEPIGTFAMNEMGNDVERAPGVFAFVAEGPSFGKIAEECVEGGGSAGEKGDGLGQVVLHCGPRFILREFHESMIVAR
jgi:hypothetical protein